MKKIILFYICLFSISISFSQTSKLKSIIYDFDGLDIGQTDLPDGDYKNFDLSYHVAANPLTASDMLGDRVLQLDLNWSGGTGEFGKGITKYIQLDITADRFNFYCYNPLSNYSSGQADVIITEDDNQNGIYESPLDDKWVSSVTIPRSAEWQLISIPLNAFTDGNSGGNGIFDAGYIGNAGKIFNISLLFHRAPGVTNLETFFIDMLCFSQGTLPHGSTILDLPAKATGGRCLLGSYAYRSPADSVPPEVEAMFPAVNKLKYVNIFMPFAYSGITADVLPGNALQRLINKGCRPLITWEMMYTAFASIDPVQPRLNLITNGSFDGYIDAFAAQVKTYSDTVIMRPFHEFDGNWYPWSVDLNSQNPNNFIMAYRYIVDRFRAQGATNVLWLFSPNSAPTPNAGYNWLVDAYPGDNYVDLVGTSLYNHPLAGVPPWKSFRTLFTEVYYYMTAYFPSKPFIICESACRERYGTEPVSSQTKAEWICAMDNDLQSLFSKVRGLIFLNTNKEHDWRINSSFAAKEAVRTCIWEDPYYDAIPLGVQNVFNENNLRVFPNPFINKLNIEFAGVEGEASISVYDLLGREKWSSKIHNNISIGEDFLPGIYILEIKNVNFCRKIKVVKQ